MYGRELITISHVYQATFEESLFISLHIFNLKNVFFLSMRARLLQKRPSFLLNGNWIIFIHTFSSGKVFYCDVCGHRMLGADNLIQHVKVSNTW